MTETTYTVLHNDGGPIAEGLTRADAAREVLGYDGYDWAIRPSEYGHTLWHSRFSRNASGGNGGLVSTTISSAHDDEEAAEADIFDKVCYEAYELTRGSLDVLTDARYAEIMAEAEAEGR